MTQRSSRTPIRPCAPANGLLAGLGLALPLGIALAVLVASAAWSQQADVPQADVQPADLEDARVFYRDNCARCHTIGGGRLTGPDLKDVDQRQSRQWLLDFVLDPQARIDAGDPYALQLFEAARGVVMPQVVGLDTQRAESLLDMIAEESALEASEFSTPQVPPDPFTDSDRTIGNLLFTGKAPLRSGASPCAGCHDLAGLDGWGGGRMAPDLSRLWERLGGRAAVAAWLQAPEKDAADSPLSVAVTHRPMETSEVLPLSALLEAAARSGRSHRARSQLLFSATAWGVAALFLMLTAWLTGRRAVPEDRASEVAGRSAPWAAPCLLLGLAVVAVFHLLPLVAPGAVLALTQRPQTLWGLETAHLAAGLLTLCGLLGLRRSKTQPRPRTQRLELAFLCLLGLSIATGVLTAVVHRWGLAWFAGWLTPGLAALLRGELTAASWVDALPLLTRLHMVTGLAALLLLPFTRWRSLLDPRRLDPRKIPWRSLDPRRLNPRRLDPRRLLPSRRGKSNPLGTERSS